MLMHTDIWRGGSLGLFSVSPLLRCSTQLSYVVSLKPTHNTPAPKKRGSRGTTTIRTKIGYELWNGRKKSRAINARGMTGFFADAWLSCISPLSGCFRCLIFFRTCFFPFSLSFSNVFRMNPTSRHMEMMMATESMCEEREDEGKKRFLCLVMCPIKCAAFLFTSHRKSRLPSDFAANRELSENESSSAVDLSRERHRLTRAASKAIEIRRTLFVLTQRL